MSDETVFLIAEIGSNHNGDLQLAHLMIDHAARDGADAAKFQTFSADLLYSTRAPRLEEMKNFEGVADDVTPHQLAGKLEMDRSWLPPLADHCKDVGIEFMSTPFDLQAVDVLDPLVERHKIASFDVDNKELIQKVAACGKPIVLSTGHSYLGEVEAALQWIRQIDPSVQVTLLQCTNQYPTMPEDVHLRSMVTMQQAFGLAVGLSDHTLGNSVSLAAVALGATVLERHVTEDVNLPGPDHRFALEPELLAELVAGARAVSQALGSPRKVPTEAEGENRKLARRSVHVARDLQAGTVLTRDDLLLVRPAVGISPPEIDRVVGRTLGQDMSAGMPLQWAHV